MLSVLERFEPRGTLHASASLLSLTGALGFEQKGICGVLARAVCTADGLRSLALVDLGEFLVAWYLDGADPPRHPDDVFGCTVNV